MTIKPVNGHILIEPIKHESFMSTSKEIYEEVGIVVETAERLLDQDHNLADSGKAGLYVKKGDKVYFDAWLAAKFPKNEKEDFWLVKFEDVRAIEKSNEK